MMSVSVREAATVLRFLSAKRYDFVAVSSLWEIKSAKFDQLSGTCWCIAETAVFLISVQAMLLLNPALAHTDCIALEIWPLDIASPRYDKNKLLRSFTNTNDSFCKYRKPTKQDWRQNNCCRAMGSSCLVISY